MSSIPRLALGPGSVPRLLQSKGNNNPSIANTFLIPPSQGSHTKVIYQSQQRWKILSLVFLLFFVISTVYKATCTTSNNGSSISSSSSSSSSSSFYQHLISNHNTDSTEDKRKLLNVNLPSSVLPSHRSSASVVNTKDNHRDARTINDVSSSLQSEDRPLSQNNNNNDESIINQSAEDTNIPNDTNHHQHHHLRGGNEGGTLTSSSSSSLNSLFFPINTTQLASTVQSSVLPCCVGDGPRKVCWNRGPEGRPYRILFHSNQLGLRGTEIGLYEYARYFEELACGEAYIATNYGSPYLETLPKFEARFPGRVHFIPRPPDVGNRRKRRVRPSVRPRSTYDSAVAEAAARAAAAAAEAAARQIQAMMSTNRVNQIYGAANNENAVLYRRPGRNLQETTSSSSSSSRPGTEEPVVLLPPPIMALPSASPSAPPLTMRYDLQNSVLNNLTSSLHIDAIFTIQPDTIPPIFIRPQPGIKLLIQGVFSGTGNFANLADAAVVVGDTVPRKENVNVVSRIVNFDFPEESIVSLRKELDIPHDATVFCRHGDIKTFNVAAARDAVCRFARAHPNRYFLFMNTEPLVCKVKNIIYLPASYDVHYKQRFLSSCNACLHGRADGETFGMAIAECSLAGLPVFTHRSMGASNHLLLLGEHAIKYNDSSTFFNALARFNPVEARHKRKEYKELYHRFSPENVMLDFLSYLGILADVISVSTMGKPLSSFTVSSVSNALPSVSAAPLVTGPVGQ